MDAFLNHLGYPKLVPDESSGTVVCFWILINPPNPFSFHLFGLPYGRWNKVTAVLFCVFFSEQTCVIFYGFETRRSEKAEDDHLCMFIWGGFQYIYISKHLLDKVSKIQMIKSWNPKKSMESTFHKLLMRSFGLLKKPWLLRHFCSQSFACHLHGPFMTRRILNSNQNKGPHLGFQVGQANNVCGGIFCNPVFFFIFSFAMLNGRFLSLSPI